MTKIKTLRESKELRQGDLANILGVSRSTVAMWETGKSSPRGETLVKLANVLGCTIDDLFACPEEGREGA